MDDVVHLWNKFNEYSNKLATALGRTSNIVGEYAEHLAHKRYGGKLLDISGHSADIESDDGTLYQVKSRKIKKTPTTQLNVIRSWNFDYLVVILFNQHGDIRQALEVPMEVAKEHGVQNKHQNGWVITTNKNFLTESRANDITHSIQKLSQENTTNHLLRREPVSPEQFGKFLNEMYFGAEDGEAVAMIHLFGIKYGQEILASDTNANQITKASGIPISHVTEVHKGIRLSKYVKPI